MQTVNITEARAFKLAVENDVKVSELEALGFTIVAGDVQVAAQTVALTITTPEINAELVAAAELLYAQGRPAKDTAAGRTRMVLSEKDGLYPYRVSVTHAE